MSGNRSLFRRSADAATAAAVTVVLAACGGSGSAEGGHGHDHPRDHGGSAPPSASATTGAHNAADVSFLRRMIQHHRQALVMADLTAARASSPKVGELAAAVSGAQAREVETMSSWLESWGEEVPEDSGHGGHGGHDGHDGHGAMPGMLSAEQMERLRTSSGKAFDTAYLELMIGHHRGAVAAAESERSEGIHNPAKDLAGTVITSQTAEIREMEELLAAVK